jgi:hypothetical protein
LVLLCFQDNKADNPRNDHCWDDLHKNVMGFGA